MRPMFMIVLRAMLVLGFVGAPSHGMTGEPPKASRVSAPEFGPNVLVLDPSMSGVQQQVDAVFARQEKNQFGNERYAILFKPGKYNLDARLGFYTQVLGLGHAPDDVEIVGGVRSLAGWRKGDATCNFWRSAENISVSPAAEHRPNVWAVSQGTALRRVHIKGDLALSDGGWSSGGFLADCRIDGQVDSGSQQQWLSRNVEWKSWIGGNWNMVFLGTTNPPAGSWPEKPYTVVKKTPLIREKPYLRIAEDGRYVVTVPDLITDGSEGATWRSGEGPSGKSGTQIPIEQFFLARADKDNAATINAALESGKHLLLTPGIYHLAEPIRVVRPHTVVLGLGYATLVPDKGTPAMNVADIDGVQVAGVICDAGEAESPTLIQVGNPGCAGMHGADPIFLYDIVCRAGGAAPGAARSFVTIESNNVVADNLWLWRADHGAGAKWDVNKNRNGLIVNGNDVTMYGLFVEHCQEYQTLWNGEGGRVYFYQSEMPYDPPSESGWSHDGVAGYASYKVAAGVRTHEAWGLGVYCVFRAAPVVAESAIEAPVASGVRLHHMVSIRLNGLPGSGIKHVVNSTGAAVTTTQDKKAQVE